MAHALGRCRLLIPRARWSSAKAPTIRGAVSSPGLRLFGDDAVMQRFLPVLRQLAPEQAAQAVIGLHKAMILNREHAALFMPLDLSIR